MRELDCLFQSAKRFFILAKKKDRRGLGNRGELHREMGTGTSKSDCTEYKELLLTLCCSK